MIKGYFISIDYSWKEYGKVIDRFIYGIVNVDLDKTPLCDIPKELISEKQPHLDLSKVTIKIAAFNNID